MFTKCEILEKIFLKYSILEIRKPKDIKQITIET